MAQMSSNDDCLNTMNPQSYSNYKIRQMLDAIEADIDRYVLMDDYPWWLIFLTKQGLWLSTQYRFSRWVDQSVHLPVIRQILKIFCALWQKLIEILTNSELPNKAEIGEGIFIPHAFGIIMHCDVKIGKNCNIGQDVTIGIGGRGEKRGSPKLGERVFIAPGARIFGNITVGNDVAIGANAVVTKDLPEQAVAVGIPAKVISSQGSQDFVHYRKK